MWGFHRVHTERIKVNPVVILSLSLRVQTDGFIEAVTDKRSLLYHLFIGFTQTEEVQEDNINKSRLEDWIRCG